MGGGAGSYPGKGAVIGEQRDDFEQAVRAFGADLYRFAYWLCRDRHLAEDVVQEACLRALRAWGELREPAQAKAWMMTIVRNEYARSLSKRKNDAALDDVDESMLPSIPPLDAAVETAQLVGLLPLAYREPLLLQVLGGFSCAEIAGMLGTTEGAIMTRLTRARQALRREMTPPDRKAASA